MNTTISTPAAAGLLVYAKQTERLAEFYAAVTGLQIRHREVGLVALAGGGVELLVHGIPEAIAQHIEIGVPPQRREDCALKFLFTVPSLDAARQQVEALGGRYFESEGWSGSDFRVCNAMDPEGNVLQLREPV